MRITPIHWSAGLTAVCLLCAGCGTAVARPGVEVIEQARAAVAAAEQADAKYFSPDNLKHAQDALAIANDAQNGGETDRAAQFAQKALRYARVAQAEAGQKRAEDKSRLTAQELDQLHLRVAQAEQAAGLPVNVTPAAQAAPVPASSPTPAGGRP